MAARVQVVSSGYEGAPGYITFYHPTDDPPDVASWLIQVNDYLTALMPLMQQAVTYRRSGDIEYFDPVSGQTFQTATVAPLTVNGSFGANHEVGGAALVMQYRTGEYLNGREVRGRHFMSGLGSIRDADGDPSPASLTIAENAMNDYVDSTLGGVWSRRNGVVVPITGGGVWSKFGLIRSRRD